MTSKLLSLYSGHTRKDVLDAVVAQSLISASSLNILYELD
jgi:hypothetical protein